MSSTLSLSTVVARQSAVPSQSMDDVAGIYLHSPTVPQLDLEADARIAEMFVSGISGEAHTYSDPSSLTENQVDIEKDYDVMRSLDTFDLAWLFAGLEQHFQVHCDRRWCEPLIDRSNVNRNTTDYHHVCLELKKELDREQHSRLEVVPDSTSLKTPLLHAEMALTKPTPTLTRQVRNRIHTYAAEFRAMYDTGIATNATKSTAPRIKDANRAKESLNNDSLRRGISKLGKQLLSIHNVKKPAP